MSMTQAGHRLRTVQTYQRKLRPGFLQVVPGAFRKISGVIGVQQAYPIPLNQINNRLCTRVMIRFQWGYRVALYGKRHKRFNLLYPDPVLRLHVHCADNAFNISARRISSVECKSALCCMAETIFPVFQFRRIKMIEMVMRD